MDINRALSTYMFVISSLKVKSLSETKPGVIPALSQEVFSH